MATKKAVVLDGNNQPQNIQAADYVDPASLGTGSTGAGTKTLFDNGTWGTAAGSSDIALSILAPAVDETITAGYSAVLVRSYTIASGKKLVLGLASRFRIL